MTEDTKKYISYDQSPVDKFLKEMLSTIEKIKKKYKTIEHQDKLSDIDTKNAFELLACQKSIFECLTFIFLAFSKGKNPSSFMLLRMSLSYGFSQFSPQHLKKIWGLEQRINTFLFQEIVTKGKGDKRKLQEVCLHLLMNNKEELIDAKKKLDAVSNQENRLKEQIFDDFIRQVEALSPDLSQENFDPRSNIIKMIKNELTLAVWTPRHPMIHEYLQVMVQLVHKQPDDLSEMLPFLNPVAITNIVTQSKYGNIVQSFLSWFEIEKLYIKQDEELTGFTYHYCNNKPQYKQIYEVFDADKEYKIMRQKFLTNAHKVMQSGLSHRETSPIEPTIMRQRIDVFDLSRETSSSSLMINKSTFFKQNVVPYTSQDEQDFITSFHIILIQFKHSIVTKNDIRTFLDQQLIKYSRTALENIVKDMIDDLIHDDELHLSPLSTLDENVQMILTKLKLKRPMQAATLEDLYFSISLMGSYSESLQKQYDSHAEMVGLLAIELRYLLDIYLLNTNVKLPLEQALQPFKAKFHAKLHSQDHVINDNWQWHCIAHNCILALYFVVLACIGKLKYTDNPALQYYNPMTKKREKLNAVDQALHHLKP